MSTRKTTAQKGQKKAAKKPPTHARKFKFVPAEGYATVVDENHGGWVTLDPVPEGGESVKTHVYIRRQQDLGERYTYRCEWIYSLRDHMRDKHDDFGFDTNWPEDNSVVVDYDKQTITFPKALPLAPPPPPDRFDDSDENRAKNKRHARALNRVLDACLVGNKAEFVKMANNFANPSSVTITASMTEAEFAEKVKFIEEARAQVEPLAKALEGLDDGEKKAITRHIAHAMGIDKGETPWR